MTGKKNWILAVGWSAAAVSVALLSSNAFAQDGEPETSEVVPEESSAPDTTAAEAPPSSEPDAPEPVAPVPVAPAPAPASTASAAPPRPVAGERRAIPVASQQVAKWVHTMDLRIRTQPTGLIFDQTLRNRSVYGREGSLLLEGAYWEYGFNAALSPALAEAGMHVEIQPIRLFILRLEYRALASFGLLGYTLSFEEDGAYGDDQVEAREGDEQTGLAHRFSVMPTIQLALGPIIVRNQTELHYHRYDGYEGPYIRERLHDTLQATDGGDFLFWNSTTLAYEIWRGTGDERWILGPFFEVARGIEADTLRQRVGGVTAYIPTNRWGNIRRPRVYAQAGVNLADRNREGEVFVQGGFGFDLWYGARNP